ncbi:MAG: hypothetical protein JNM31_05025 [Flavobacteriales bacterium]|nr:hypothetical protein [Flavobacteriales bacterium]
MRSAVLLVLLLALAAGSNAQSLRPEQMSEEVERVRKLVHGWHPDPYGCRTRAEVDALFDTLRVQCALPLPAEDYHELMSIALAGICDGATCALPPPSWEKRLRTTEPLLPLQVRIIEGGLFVDAETKGFRSLPRGSRILSIDGNESRVVLQRLERLVSADGCAMEARHRAIERDFAVLYRMVFGEVGRHMVTYEASEGERLTQVIVPLSREEMEHTRGPKPPEHAPWRYVVDEDGGTAWVELTTFDRAELEHAGVRAARFTDELAGVLRKRHIRHLVLDVRGAAGMDVHAAEVVTALFAAAPFRSLQHIQARNITPPEDARVSAELLALTDLLRSSFAPVSSGVYRPVVELPGMAMAQPRTKDGFTGRVYVVQDAATRDAAALLAMHVERSGHGTTFGGSTGSGAAHFCAGVRMTVPLKYSGVVVEMPVLRFDPADPPGTAECTGVAPQHRVEQLAQALVNGRDSVRQAVLMAIQALR